MSSPDMKTTSSSACKTLSSQLLKLIFGYILAPVCLRKRCDRRSRSFRPHLGSRPHSRWIPLFVCQGKLFIIAATAATFILDSKQLAPKEQLEILLSGLSPRDSSGSRHTFLDNMYLQILRAACPKQVGSWVGRFQIIVGTITLLQDPLPCNALAELLGIDASDIVTMLSNLHSLFAPGAEDQIFRIHHKSFPDFITDPDRREHSCEFYIDRAAHHLRIAKRCLIVMNSNLGRSRVERRPGTTSPPTGCHIPPSGICLYLLGISPCAGGRNQQHISP